MIQVLIILFVGLLFIWMPQKSPLDWDLNTKGFWTFIPQTYTNHPNFVYPPWGLILLLPYYLVQPVGARVLSVMTMGWLTRYKKWSLSIFFTLVLSPYFLLTMARSSADILVIVLPWLLWEYSRGKKGEVIIRGISLSMLLLKPQCTILIMVYLLWTNRKEWKKLLMQLGIVTLIIAPISMVGSPPLFLQWLNNISHPSSQNQLYWSVNNLSLIGNLGLLAAVGILFLAAMILLLLQKLRTISWKADQTISSLLLCSMFLSPYSSQQSFSSGLAFVPSWIGFVVQWLVMGLGRIMVDYYKNIPQLSFLSAFVSILVFSFLMQKREKNELSSYGKTISIP